MWSSSAPLCVFCKSLCSPSTSVVGLHDLDWVVLAGHLEQRVYWYVVDLSVDTRAVLLAPYGRTLWYWRSCLVSSPRPSESASAPCPLASAVLSPTSLPAAVTFTSSSWALVLGVPAARLVGSVTCACRVGVRDVSGLFADLPTRWLWFLRHNCCATGFRALAVFVVVVLAARCGCKPRKLSHNWERLSSSSGLTNYSV